MFPFTIRFSKTIDKTISPDQVNAILKSLESLLSEKGADYFSKEDNRLTFENRFFKLTSNWNLMAYTDAGFLELKKSDNDKTKIIYGIKLISIWIISSIFTMIIYFSTKELMATLIVFCFLGIFTWLISILRHWGLTNIMTENITELIDKDEN